MANYLRYIIKNISPVSVTDNAVSQPGQANTLCYIPGSAVRGMIINTFASRGMLENNPKLKLELFADSMVYTNAYLTTGSHSLIPSPKGFYEDKINVDGIKELSSNVVVDGNIKPGTKRATLGKYCYIENECINYFSVKTGSDLKIKINGDSNIKSEMFRCEYIAPNQYFEGYVRLTNTEADSLIKELFRIGNIVMLGNSRSSGHGKCEVILSDITNKVPYQCEGFEAENECYIELLSDTVMRSDSGEICGLNIPELERKFGVNNLTVRYCSTSTRTINGYNRTWQSRIPAIVTYEQGSVFKFSFDGKISSSAMERIADEGIGIRRNEGFGRILFLKNYEKVKYKLSHAFEFDSCIDKKLKSKDLPHEDYETLRIVAKGYCRDLIYRRMEEFVVTNPIKRGGLKNNQLGTVESFATALHYNPENARKRIADYLDHTEDKEQKQNIQKTRASVKPFRTYIFNNILDKNLSDILFDKSELENAMGISLNEIFNKNEQETIKLELLIKMIRHSYKEV